MKLPGTTSMPAEVSQAGTNAMMPSTGMTACSHGLKRWPGRAKKPMQAAFIRM